MVNGEPSHPGSEALVEPELAPPVHSDKVAEPLMSKLVGNNVSDSVTIAVGGSLLIEEHCGCSVFARVSACFELNCDVVTNR
jgi:hypothetical protein